MNPTKGDTGHEGGTLRRMFGSRAIGLAIGTIVLAVPLLATSCSNPTQGSLAQPRPTYEPTRLGFMPSWTIFLCPTRTGMPSTQSRPLLRSFLKHRLQTYGIGQYHLHTRSNGCQAVNLPHGFSWVRTLARDLRRQGVFALATITSATHRPKPGDFVRLRNETANRHTRHLAVARVIVARPGIQRWSVNMDAGNSATNQVRFRLSRTGRASWCRFARSHRRPDVVILVDRQVAAHVAVHHGACSAAMRLSIPEWSAEPGPLAAESVAAYLRLGPVPIPWRQVRYREANLSAGLGPQGVPHGVAGAHTHRGQGR